MRSRVNSGSCFTFTLPVYTNQQVTSVPTPRRGSARAMGHAAPTPANDPAAASQVEGKCVSLEVGTRTNMDLDDLPPSPRQETAAKVRDRRPVSRLSSMSAKSPGVGPAGDGEVIQKHEDVQYDPAQLAALASSKPYSSHNSRRPSVQFADAEMAAKLDALAVSSSGSSDRATLRARQTFLAAAAVGSSGGASAAADGDAGGSRGTTVSNRGSTAGGVPAKDGGPLLHKPTWSMQHGKVQILSGEGHRGVARSRALCWMRCWTWHEQRTLQ